jgi:hypothetical protein
VKVGQNATFSITASGPGPLAYQWQRNNVNIPGASAAAYTTPSAAKVDDGSKYRCIVTNPGGSATSDSATMSVSMTGTGNQPPVIGSKPTAAPNPARVGESINFTVAASDPDNDALIYLWSFGDDIKSDVGSHAYLAAGKYTVTVTATDPSGASATDSVVVTVLDANNGGGGGGTNPNTVAFAVSSMQGSVKFSVAGKDKVSLKGTLPDFPLPFNAAGQSVSIDVGGVLVTFLLGSNGKARSNGSSFTFVLKQKKLKGGKAPPGVAFSAMLKNGTWATVWKFDPALSSDKKPMTMLVTIEVAGTSYATEVNATYSSKAQRSALFRK